MESIEVESGPLAGVPGDVDVITVLGPDGAAGDKDPKLDADLLRRAYETMVRTRLLDARLSTLASEGAIGFHHGGVGEEAAVVVAAAAFRDEDWLIAAARTTGAYLWRGVSVAALVDHAFANADDPARGRRMPGHPTARAKRITSASTLKGAQIGQATGVGWAARLRGEPVAAGVWLDESEVASNDFHTGLNFAGVFEAPTVFICRNARWNDRDLRSGPTETLAEKGVVYGVPAVRADGTDPLAVWVAVREGVEQAARGHGPTLVELLTRRATSLPDDVDPVARLALHLGLSSEDRRSIQTSATEEIDAAVAAAATRAGPAPTTMFEDVYGDVPGHLEDQRRTLPER